MQQQRLGKGLEALLGAAEDEQTIQNNTGTLEININDIDPNMNQARKEFDPEKLEELSRSIAVHGIVQPILVKPNGRRYILIAGERRWRAARMAGLSTIPAVVRDLDERSFMEVSLVENLQRSDLNPVEEAAALKFLQYEYGLTQDEIAHRIGKSRSAIANTIRLLNLPDEILDHLKSGKLTAGHGRSLVALEDRELQLKLAKKMVEQDLSVREAESLLKKATPKPEKRRSQPCVLPPELYDFERALCERLGTRVEVRGGAQKGRITIEYFSREDLERICTFLGIN
ncbi:MAG: ParB/RepB/Spo0J family partition protein [Bacillota bacterium]|nr:ParB/RepB/Spo0J family partition protein [Bacillota bacterium]